MNKIPQYDLKYWIRTFEELSEEEMAFAGGKGKTLARLRQAGYPVPDGFIILPQAFSGDRLRPEAWEQVETSLRKMCAVDDTISFAVRSSALAEDSPQASFAGEFETVLDVHTREIHAAIHSVRASHKSVRVKAYSAARGVDTVHDLAVVIQRLVRADISGVLFTADPVTGAYANMVGNFVYGFGEDLVSGERAYTKALLISNDCHGSYINWPTAWKSIWAARRILNGL